jgi:hypothetical protein
MLRRDRAGTPAHTSRAGTSSSTTEPIPTSAHEPTTLCRSERLNVDGPR